jgi:hypothetical protein
MNKPALQFLGTAEAHQQVREFRADVNQTVARYFLDANGRALLIMTGNDLEGGRMRQVMELPPWGTYELYSGTFGGNWTYTFHPLLDGGCELTVVFNGSFPPYPETVEPFYLVLPDDPCPADAIYYPGINREVDLPDPEAGYRLGMLFHIGSERLNRLAAWSTDRPWTHFDFNFTPTSVGMKLSVRHRPTGEILDLTRDDEI